jgi:hypothetical protein
VPGFVNYKKDALEIILIIRQWLVPMFDDVRFLPVVVKNADNHLICEFTSSVTWSRGKSREYNDLIDL